ncbi:unnamed protein product [Euphydryas editha]|uniref:Peptidase S1 domain-containing protein n=1 Tax=Euphydryas editha TaxID=104508 RepID=A0AAU9UTU8_EUPED|nr:unnamed protein product [Euphydryas editha]
METYCFVIGLLLLGVSGLKEGDECISPEGNGICKGIRNCETAIKDLINGKKLKICSRARELTVCCLDPQVMTTLKSVKSVTTTKPILFKRSCDSIPNNITVPMRKSLQKCLEYQERLIYPCQESLIPSAGMVRENRCNWKPENLIIGGVNSYRGEFPHMVHLGYGENYTKWKCGGVLVSENFVLTAGHCTYSRFDGPVNKIRIAFHKISETIMDFNLYNVKNIYKHNSYKSPLLYNDIALLETDRT